MREDSQEALTQRNGPAVTLAVRQWRKLRWPVNTIAAPASLTASITSKSRTIRRAGPLT